jgi:SAM-dependent methyltransferase
MGASLFDQRPTEGLLIVTGALEAGLIDALAKPGPHTAGAVAAAVDGDLRATGVMLEALAVLGIAERDAAEGSDGSAGSGSEATFSLTAQGRRHLIDPGPDYERYSLLHQVTKMRGWLELSYVVKHGHPPADVSRPRSLRSFVRTMAEGDPELMDEVVGRCVRYAAPQPVRSMLDVGGAVGHMAARFAARGVEATLCDRPAVLDEARDYLGDRAGSVRLVACDLTHDLPRGPYDLVYLGNVLHIFGPDTNKFVCRRVFAELNPGGSIAIRDFVWERSPRSAVFAVNMLQATSEGGVWREEQFREWLIGAGFVDIDVVDLERSQNQLILARRPLSG